MKNIREFFTSRCGATFDENSVPLGQGGTSGGFERGNKPNPVLAPLSRWFDPAPTNTAHPTTPAVAVGPASPPRLRRGAYFQESIAAAVFPVDAWLLEIWGRVSAELRKDYCQATRSLKFFATVWKMTKRR